MALKDDVRIGSIMHILQLQNNCAHVPAGRLRKQHMKTQQEKRKNARGSRRRPGTGSRHSQQVEFDFGSQSRCRASEFRLLRPLCSKARRIAKALTCSHGTAAPAVLRLNFEGVHLGQLTQVPLGIKTKFLK